LEDAIDALNDIMLDKKFGDSGNEVVIEEFLEGVEASILSIYDGERIIPFVSAKDHKKIGEKETGLNTGGMGVIAPNPYVTGEVNEAFYKDILNPTLEGLKAEYEFFAGIIFFGLMINKRGVYLLEYNMRLGDPETQVVLALMENDLLELIDKGDIQTARKLLKELEQNVAGGDPELTRMEALISFME
jgi:phosphoribosylamine--glycine ligase